MSAMPLLRLIAVLLLAATTGCAATQLFSKNDAEEEFQLDARPINKTSTAGSQAATSGGDWNVVQEPGDTQPVAPSARPPAALPIAELLDRAERARKQQRFPEARRHLEAILRQQPAHPVAHHRLAVISDLEGLWGDAEHHYQLALQSDPYNPDVVGDLGYSYLLQGRLPLAEQHLLQARQLDPSNQNIAHNLAQLYSRQGDLASAHRALVDVFSPPDVEQLLARMFPGTSLQGLANNVAPVVAPESPAWQQPPSADLWQTPPATPDDTGSPQYETAMVGAPAFAGPTTAMAQQTVNAIPNADAQPVYVNAPAGVAQPLASPSFGLPSTRPYGVEQVAASGTSLQANGAGIDQTSAASGTRRWPPALWPPESDSGASHAPAAASTSPTPSRTGGGVTYLLPRRPQPAPGTNFNSLPPTGSPATTVPPAAPGAAPLSPAPADAARFENPAQYSTGPGASRIVTWSNLNGQSVEVPPLPPTDEELRAAAALGLGGATPPGVLRSSPGSASGWNGGYYPPPARQLTSTSPALSDYPQQGAPLRATAPGTAPAVPAAAAMPHAGFIIEPANVPPINPLATYEQDRRQYDQQFQQQVEQTYAQSPTGYVRPPAESIPVPTYTIPGSPSGPNTGAPLTPNGTPWPGRTAAAGAPPSATGQASNAIQAPGPTGPVAPLPYQSRRAATQSVTPPAYQRPSSLSYTVDQPGPMIVPRN